MSDIKKSFSDLIGNTPLYAAEKFAAKAGANAQILAKLPVPLRIVSQTP